MRKRLIEISVKEAKPIIINRVNASKIVEKKENKVFNDML